MWSRLHLAVVVFCSLSFYFANSETPEDCESAQNPVACGQLSGCIYKQDTYSYCSSTKDPSICSNATEENACTGIGTECYWSDGCFFSDTCVDESDKDICSNKDGCKWITENDNYCTEDVVECDEFKNKTACNSAKTTDGDRACSFYSSVYADCVAYNPCSRLTNITACQQFSGVKCVWNNDGDGDEFSTMCDIDYSNSDSSVGEQNCYGDDEYPYDSKNCSQGDRTGTDPSKSCEWVVTTDPICEEYDPCADATSQNACGALTGCEWMDEDDEGNGRCQSACDDDGNGCNNGGGDSDLCDAIQTSKECIGILKNDGSAQCAWVKNEYTSCEPIDKCRYGTVDNCSTVTLECIYSDDGDGSGSCYSDSSGQNETCLDIDYTTEACPAESGCELVTYNDGYCQKFDACSTLLNKTACEQYASSTCIWDIGINGGFCFLADDNDDGSNDDNPGDTGCYSAKNSTVCRAVLRSKDDTSSDPACSWTITIDAFCQKYDACNTFNGETECTSAGCTWDSEDDGDIDPYCFNNTETDPDDTNCDAFDDDKDKCNEAYKNTPDSPQVCAFVVQNFSYCTEYSKCIDGNTYYQEGCDSVEGCWWNAYGPGMYDGECDEGSRPASTTSGTTTDTLPAPTAAPTVFSCHQNEFKCISVDKCIDITWKCDTQQDCPDSSDEQNCPTVTSTTTTATPRDCEDYEYRCENRECKIDFFKILRCDGKADCSDGSDERGCPTSPPSSIPTATQPVTSKPTYAPTPLPTLYPTPVPKCYTECNNSTSTILEAKHNPHWDTPALCRMCVDDTNYASLQAWCNNKGQGQFPLSSACGTRQPTQDGHTYPPTKTFMYPTASPLTPRPTRSSPTSAPSFNPTTTVARPIVMTTVGPGGSGKGPSVKNQGALTAVVIVIVLCLLLALGAIGYVLYKFKFKGATFKKLVHENPTYALSDDQPDDLNDSTEA